MLRRFWSATIGKSSRSLNFSDRNSALAHQLFEGVLLLRRLHWGCGPITPYGWVNSDLYPGPGVDLVADIRGGLPVPDGTFDYIVAIHVLPEIAYTDLDRARTELRRVLRPGGVLRLGLPDLDKAIQAYLANDLDYFIIPDEVVTSLAGKMIVQLLWYGRSRTMFTAPFAEELLARNGFQSIGLCPFRQTASDFPGIVELDDRELESFFIEGTK
jgi:SAM-dependent methyltransferase